MSTLIDFFTIIININLLILFVLCITLFFKQGVTFKLFTVLIFLNMLYKWFFTFYGEQKLSNYIFWIIQFSVISSIYYTLLIRKKKLYLLIACVLFIPIMYVLNIYTKLTAEEIARFGTLSTYLVIILGCSLYLFQHMGKKKEYKYFNKGLSFFVVTTIVLYLVIGTIFAANQWSDENLFFSYLLPFVLAIELVQQFFYYKQWFYIKSTKTLSNKV